MLKEGTVLYLHALCFIRAVNKLELYGGDADMINDLIYKHNLEWTRLLDQLGIRTDKLLRYRR